MKNTILQGLFFLGVLLLFHSCELFDRKKEFKVYTIPKGKQNSNNSLTLFTHDELKFLAKFDHTAIYTTQDTINQLDVNKLYGFSDCASPHHRNSARFGWRWYKNFLEVFAYSYTNGVRSSKFMTVVNLEQEYEYMIKLEDDVYIFYVNGVTVTLPRGCSAGGVKYYLFPYFGGDEKAPHEISIRIKEL